jgi:hypothetical protein
MHSCPLKPASVRGLPNRLGEPRLAATRDSHFVAARQQRVPG